LRGTTKTRQQPQGAANLEPAILSTALSLLAARSHSEEQLRRRLAAKFGAAPEIDSCIGLLKQKGYVNDARLAESYAAHRTGIKAIGRARLARELASKLLSKEVIESTLNRAFRAVPEEELIDRALDKRVRTKGVPVSQSDRKKMFDYLVRLGFDYDLILRKVRSLGATTDLKISDD
jgi:regulatory protein